MVCISVCMYIMLLLLVENSYKLERRRCNFNQSLYQPAPHVKCHIIYCTISYYILHSLQIKQLFSFSLFCIRMFDGLFVLFLFLSPMVHGAVTVMLLIFYPKNELTKNKDRYRRVRPRQIRG